MEQIEALMAQLAQFEWYAIADPTELTAVRTAEAAPLLIMVPAQLQWATAALLLNELQQEYPTSTAVLLTPHKMTIPQLPHGHLVAVDHPQWVEGVQRIAQAAQAQWAVAHAAQRHERTLGLLSHMSQQIFLPNQLDWVLADTLPQLGQILGVTRIGLFERVLAPPMPRAFNHRYQWATRGSVGEFGHGRRQTFTFDQFALTDWLEQLEMGESIAGNVVDFEPHKQQFLQEIMGTQAILLVPIFCGNIWWGFLEIDDANQVRSWDTADMDAIHAIANVMGAAVENARLFTAERRQLQLAQSLSELSQRQTDELAGLYNISMTLTGILKPDILMERLEEQIILYLNPDIIITALYDAEAEEMMVLTAKQFGQIIEAAPVGQPIHPQQGGLMGWIILNQKSILIHDMQNEAPPTPLRMITEPPRSWLGLPLVANGRVVGVVSVQSFQPHAFDRDHIRFMESVTVQAALAVESAHLFQTEAKRRQEAELLHQLASQLNDHTLDHTLILQSALKAVRSFIPDLSVGLINMVDESGRYLIPQVIDAADPRYIITAVGQKIDIQQTQSARQAVEEKRTIVHEDLHLLEPASGRTQKIVEKGLRSLLYVPVMSNGVVIGLLNLNMWDKPRYFTRHEVEFCEIVASHVGITLESTRLYAQEALRRQEAELLHKLTSSLLETNNLKQIATLAIHALRERLPQVNYCYFSLLDTHGKEIIPLAGWVAEERFAFSSFFERTPLAQTNTTKKVFETKQTVYVPDLAKMPNLTPRTQTLIDKQLRALLYVPLLVHERPIGILHIHIWETAAVISPTEIRFCELVANHVALATENARLLAVEREQLRLAQTLRDVGALLTTSLRLDEVFERIFDLLSRVIQYDTVTIQLHNSATGQMYLAAGRGFDDLERTAEIVEFLGHATINRMTNQTYIIVQDTTTSDDWIPVAGAAPIRSCIRCSLRIKNKLVGVLNVDSFQPFAYTDEMAETVAAFANQAVIAIENARLYEEVNQRVQKLSIFNEIAFLSATSLDVDQLIGEATRILTTNLYHTHFGFLLLDDTRSYLLQHRSYYAPHIAPRPPQRLNINNPKGIVVHVARTGEAYLVRNTAEDPLYLPNDPTTRSELAIPLKVDAHIIGVMNVESPRPHAFDEEDLSFLSTLSRQMATAIQRAQLYEGSQFYAAQLEDKVAYRTAELQEERDRTRAILDSAGEGIIFTDSEGIILYANMAMSAQTGYDTAELVGRAPDMLNSGLTPNHVFSDLWNTARGGERWRGQVTNRRKDGTLYSAAITVTPLYDQHTLLTGFVSVQSDITQLKELDRLKSEFVTNVSHELRTPLTNIRTFVDLLKIGRPEKHEHYRQVLERETDRLTRLIQDLLDLSRLETNTTRINLEPTDIGELLDNLIQNFTYKAQEKMITLADERPPHLPLVLMDEDQIVQVLTNLLGNALAYTPAHGRITLHTAPHTYSGQPMLRVQVQDTGMGLTNEDKKHIFERFFRGEAASESRSPGTGLGLAISKEIIDRHNGFMEVDGQPHQGATFTIWLPLAES